MRDASVRIELRPTLEADAHEMHQAMSAEHLGNFKFFEDPPSLARQEAFLREKLADPTAHLFNIYVDDVLVGTAGLNEHDSVLRTARLGVMIFSPSMRGKGIGTAAIRKLLHIGFTELDLNKAYLNVFAHNTHGQALYTRIGFQREGLLREEYILHGEFLDLVRMSMLKREWLALQG